MALFFIFCGSLIRHKCYTSSCEILFGATTSLIEDWVCLLFQAELDVFLLFYYAKKLDYSFGEFSFGEFSLRESGAKS